MFVYVHVRTVKLVYSDQLETFIRGLIEEVAVLQGYSSANGSLYWDLY